MREIKFRFIILALLAGCQNGGHKLSAKDANDLNEANFIMSQASRWCLDDKCSAKSLMQKFYDCQRKWGDSGKPYSIYYTFHENEMVDLDALAENESQCLRGE